MDTQWSLLVCFCLLTPLVQCCCRSNLQDKRLGSEHADLLIETDVNSSPWAGPFIVFDSWIIRFQDLLSSVVLYLKRLVLPEPTRVSLCSLKKSTCTETVTRLLSRGRKLLTDSVGPALFNLLAWLVVFWMFRRKNFLSSEASLQPRERVQGLTRIANKERAEVNVFTDASSSWSTYKFSDTDSNSLHSLDCKPSEGIDVPESSGEQIDFPSLTDKITYTAVEKQADEDKSGSYILPLHYQTKVLCQQADDIGQSHVHKKISTSQFDENISTTDIEEDTSTSEAEANNSTTEPEVTSTTTDGEKTSTPGESISSEVEEDFERTLLSGDFSFDETLLGDSSPIALKCTSQKQRSGSAALMSQFKKDPENMKQFFAARTVSFLDEESTLKEVHKGSIPLKEKYGQMVFGKHSTNITMQAPKRNELRYTKAMMEIRQHTERIFVSENNEPDGNEPPAEGISGNQPQKDTEKSKGVEGGDAHETESMESIPEWADYEFDDTEYTGSTLDEDPDLCQITEDSTSDIVLPSRPDGLSNMAKFHSFCRQLLDTNSFHETENDDERFAVVEKEIGPGDELLLTMSNVSLQEKSSTSSLPDDRSIMPEQTCHDKSRPSVPITLGDPDGLLEKVPLLHEMLLSSCFEVVSKTPWSSPTEETAVDQTSTQQCGPSIDGQEKELIENLPCAAEADNEGACSQESTENSWYLGDSEYEQLSCKRAPRAKGTVKVTEIPMDMDFVYMSCGTGKLVPVKDFIKVLETCCLGTEEKKTIVSQQYKIAREKCCLDWIEAIRNRGKKILPKWWLHRNLRVEGLESNKCRKRREWLEKKQAQALEEQAMREKKDLIFLGTKPDIDIYLDGPEGPEKQLFRYGDDGTPVFRVEQYFATVSQDQTEETEKPMRLEILNQGLPSRWQGIQTSANHEASPDSTPPKPSRPENAWGEPRNSRRHEQNEDFSNNHNDRVKQNGSGDTHYGT